MTEKQVIKGFLAAIDQWYHFPNSNYVRDNQLHHIGGILQAALHILSTDNYYELKQYVFDTYGYDPGGCSTGQISLEDMKPVETDDNTCSFLCSHNKDWKCTKGNNERKCINAIFGDG